MKFEKDWQKAKNILCIRLDSIGDVLMTTPAIRALKESLPGRRITLLTSRSGARIAPLIPELDETLTYDPPWMKATRPRDNTRADFTPQYESQNRRRHDVGDLGDKET